MQSAMPIRASLLVAFVATASTMCIDAAEPARRCRGVEVSVRTLSWTDTEKLIGRQHGKVVLVDVWTTTCPTCRADFPEFVELQRRLGRSNLACITLNCDYDGIPEKPPKYYVKRVLEFLADNRATGTNVLLSDPLLDFLNAADIGATPTYLLYGPDGKLLRQFDGSREEFQFTEVVQAVESAISAVDKRRNTAASD